MEVLPKKSHDPSVVAKRSVWIPSIFGLTIFIILLTSAFAIPPRADDIYWHIETGDFILTNGEVINRNTFSFTAPNYPWLAHSWGTEVIFFLIYNYLGYKGLIILAIALFTLTAILMYKIALQKHSSPIIPACITLICSFFLLANFSLRPYLFGNCLLALLLLLLDHDTLKGAKRKLLFIGIFVLWANLHGSFVLGLFILGLSAIIPRPTWKRADDFFVAILACLATPHHIYGIIFPLQYAENIVDRGPSFLSHISEWQALDLFSPLGMLALGFVGLCAIVVLASKKPPLAIHVAYFLTFSASAFLTVRSLPLMALGTLPLISRHCHLLSQNLKTENLPRWVPPFAEMEKRSRKLLLPIIAVAIMSFSLGVPDHFPISYSALTEIRTVRDLSPRFFPQGLIEYLNEHDRPSRLFHHFDWGGALLFGLSQDQPLFIDQRNDCYPLDIHQDYLKIHRLDSDWSEVIDRWEIDAIAYPAGSALSKRLRRDPRWTVEYEDSEALLFSRIAEENRAP